MKLKLNIAWLYPDLMSTYGDRGNIICLQKRCQWREIDVKIYEISLDSDSKLLRTVDLLFMGGAQDRQQKIISRDFLQNKAPEIRNLVKNNIPGLFVCAAYQYMGHFYQPYQGDKIMGAGIFDLHTEHPGDQAKRLIGNVVAKILKSHFYKNENHISDQKKFPRVEPENDTSFRETIVGFENHGGRTYLGPNMRPLAKIIKGNGNNGEDGFEGAVYLNAIGSYLHGPILSKNPHLADWLIAMALTVKYAKIIRLPILDDNWEWQAHKQANKLS